MKFKTLLLPIMAFVLVPLLTVIAALYFSAFMPVGTFRVIEKNEAAQPAFPAASSGSTNLSRGPILKGNADGTIAIQEEPLPEPIVQEQKNISRINSNGTVRVNNFA